VQHGSTDLRERAARVHGAPAQLAEGFLLRHGVASHHEPLGLLDDLPVRQGLPELLQIAVALHGEVQGGRDLRYAHWLDQVGHHPAVPGHLDEPAIGATCDEYYRAAGLVAEAGEHLASGPDRRRGDQGDVRPAAVDGADGFLGRFVLEDNDPAGGVNRRAQIGSCGRHPAQDGHAPARPCRSHYQIVVSHEAKLRSGRAAGQITSSRHLTISSEPILRVIVIETTDLTLQYLPIRFGQPYNRRIRQGEPWTEGHF